jgi:hypothetical protein
LIHLLPEDVSYKGIDDKGAFPCVIDHSAVFLCYTCCSSVHQIHGMVPSFCKRQSEMSLHCNCPSISLYIVNTRAQEIKVRVCLALNYTTNFHSKCFVEYKSWRSVIFSRRCVCVMSFHFAEVMKHYYIIVQNFTFQEQNAFLHKPRQCLMHAYYGFTCLTANTCPI